MKIESNGEEKITVTLSQTDMNDLDITYDDMDYSNIETRRVIWTILDKARKALGKSVNTDDRLLIEVTPSEDGGCILYFSNPSFSDCKNKKRLIMKKDADPIIFCAWDENSFIDCLKIVSETKDFIKFSEAYKYKNGFYIIVRPKLTFSEKILHILCEFGNASISPESEISKIYEYGHCLS